ncbi:MAG: oligosaccharide flippase family protein [Chloroflexaceae bacterium]|nr:oligosaccharide flippase family protein [Chloroflexaceae bacterium]
MTRNLIQRLTQSRFGRQVGTVLGAQLLSLALGFVNTALLARWLGAGGKGTLDLVLLVPEVLALFLGLGVGVSNVYFASSRRFGVAELSANSVLLALGGTLAGSLLLVSLLVSGGAALLVPGVPPELLLAGLPLLAVALLRNAFAALLRGVDRISEQVAVDVGQQIGVLLLGLLLVGGLGAGLPGAVLAGGLARVGGGLAMALLVRQAGGRWWPRWHGAVLRATLDFGLRSYVANVLQFFNYRLDAFLVNGFLGPAAVGVYNVAVRLAELLWQLPNAVGFVLLPRAAASKPEALSRFTRRVFWLTSGVTAAGAAGLALLGQPLIVLLFSATFAEAYPALLLLLPGVVLLGGAKVLINDVVGRGFPHYNSITSGLGLVVTIALDLLLIPQLGINGAALASSASYAATFFLTLVIYQLVQRRSAAQS